MSVIHLHKTLSREPVDDHLDIINPGLNCSFGNNGLERSASDSRFCCPGCPRFRQPFATNLGLPFLGIAWCDSEFEARKMARLITMRHRDETLSDGAKGIWIARS